VSSWLFTKKLKVSIMSVILGILSEIDVNRATAEWPGLTCLWCWDLCSLGLCGCFFRPANVGGEGWICSDPLSNPGVMGVIYVVVGNTSLHINSYKKQSYMKADAYGLSPTRSSLKITSFFLKFSLHTEFVADNVSLRYARVYLCVFKILSNPLPSP